MQEFNPITNIANNLNCIDYCDVHISQLELERDIVQFESECIHRKINKVRKRSLRKIRSQQRRIEHENRAIKRGSGKAHKKHKSLRWTTAKLQTRTSSNKGNKRVLKRLRSLSSSIVRLNNSATHKLTLQEGYKLRR